MILKWKKGAPLNTQKYFKVVKDKWATQHSFMQKIKLSEKNSPLTWYGSVGLYHVSNMLYIKV